MGWNILFWNNHDLPRIVSRWGNDKDYRKESAKMLATLLHGMKGTPYIYQGEEIGMTNFYSDNIDDYPDIETRNIYNERISKNYSNEELMHSIQMKARDNARTPMQWSDSINGGFTKGTPWMKVNPNYTFINVEDSIKLIAQGGSFLFAIAACNNVAQGGATLCTMMLTKDKKLKSAAASSGISALLGITEPAMFGVNLKLKFPFYAAMI